MKLCFFGIHSYFKVDERNSIALYKCYYCNKIKESGKASKLTYTLIKVDRTWDNYWWNSEIKLIIDYKFGHKLTEAIKPCHTSQVQKPRNYVILKELDEYMASCMASAADYDINFHMAGAYSTIDGRFIDRPNIITICREYKEGHPLYRA